MICRSSIRRFDGDASSTLHAAVLPRGAGGLRFLAWATLDKGTGRYASFNLAPAVTLAWIPRDAVTDETSNAAEIDAALEAIDQVPLVVVPRRSLAVAYVSDEGASFPTVGIKGTAMVLALRVEMIAAGTHGQFTFGWAEAHTNTGEWT